MKRNPYYFLREIGDDFYLLPYGQAIEIQAPTIRVNEVTAFLWVELDRCGDIMSLAARLAEEYEAEPDEIAMLEEDVRAVLQNLKKTGIVFEEEPAVGDSRFGFHLTGFESKRGAEAVRSGKGKAGEFADSDCADGICRDGIENFLEIAGITIRFYGKPEYFSKRFEAFCKDRGVGKADISISVTEKEPPEIDHLSNVLQGRTITVQDAGGFYIMKSRETPVMREAHISKEGSRAVIYIDREAEYVDSAVFAEIGYEELPEYISEMTPADFVFHVIRHPFLLMAQRRGMYVIHSASILYDGKAWLFSALSGTGKSTHTEIWHRVYGTPYLDGDLNLIAFEDGVPVVKGIPWCGTSGIYTTKTYPLGGIILLARSPRNFVESLPLTEQILGIQMRFISPKWTEEQASGCFDFAEKIARAARIARLHCNMEDEAAQVCRDWIDGG